MIINDKIFLSPSKGENDIKDLFKQIAAAGAGRPLGKDGFPAGPWTAELLSDAISRLDPDGKGVDLRTVQLWFQDNDKGISPTNIRWLARILGCDDPDATSQWQVELAAAQFRLKAKRREAKKTETDQLQQETESLHNSTADNNPDLLADPYQDTGADHSKSQFGLAMKTEALFTRGSPLDLPVCIFAGAAGLGFLSFMMGIHNATYIRRDGLVKQVGFFWAPNWTILFMVFLPLFFAFLIELLAFWKKEGRLKLVRGITRSDSDKAWSSSVNAFSKSFWAVFLICVLVAGFVQWIGVSLIPLVKGAGNYAIDWGKLPLARPDVISVPATLVFTGLAYLYMSICFYIFFAGLILLYTLVQDLWRTAETAKSNHGQERELAEAGARVMSGVFRCTLLGITIAICMKAQSAYLASGSRNIVAWLANDMASVFYRTNQIGQVFTYRMPTHYSSLLIAISTCVVFGYAALRLGAVCRSRLAVWRKSAIVGFLLIGYSLIDVVAGFSILLTFGGLFALYGLINPELKQMHSSLVQKG
ncbi:RcgA family putative transporter [Rhizobium sp.]|uniref:RcgA family putative transporter n=1 Tax=Rhizobium sp. TaxID=391 RepID=UPI00289C68E5